MLRLMEKIDKMQIVAEVRLAKNVWYENVSANGGFAPFPLTWPR